MLKFTVLDTLKDYYTGCVNYCDLLVQCIDKVRTIDISPGFLAREEIPIVNAMRALRSTDRSRLRTALCTRLSYEQEALARVVCPVCNAPMEQGYDCDSPYIRCIEITRCSADAAHHKRERIIRSGIQKHEVIDDNLEDEFDIENINELEDWEIKKLFKNDVY